MGIFWNSRSEKRSENGVIATLEVREVIATLEVKDEWWLMAELKIKNEQWRISRPVSS